MADGVVASQPSDSVDLPEKAAPLAREAYRRAQRISLALGERSQAAVVVGEGQTLSGHLRETDDNSKDGQCLGDDSVTTTTKTQRR